MSRCLRIADISAVQICGVGIRGALSLTSLYARVEDSDFPSLAARDDRVVAKTQFKHPTAQCRLDTLVAGILCPVSKDVSVSYADPKAGVCVRPQFEREARPLCWYRPD